MLPEAPPGEEKKPPPGAQRIQEALFSGVNEREEKSEIEIDSRLTVSDREILQTQGFRADDARPRSPPPSRRSRSWRCRSTWCGRGA